MIQLEQYRDKWLAENIMQDDYIGFYEREFSVFSNFSSFKVLFRGVLYSTSEHAYQATRFIKTAPKIYEEICNAYSPNDAQKIAWANQEQQDPKFNGYKDGEGGEVIELMEEIIRAKMEQNPYVKQKLLQTENYVIVEDSPVDSFWGIGGDRKGRNELGKLWMKLRSELQIEEKK